MSFTYSWSSSPIIARVRQMIGDTDSTPPGPFYQDDEIMGVLQANSSQNIIVGLSGYSPAIPVQQVYSYGRTAATLLNGLGAVRARNMFRQITGITTDGARASEELRKLGQTYIDQEKCFGYFAVAEIVTDQFSARERYDAMVLRQGT